MWTSRELLVTTDIDSGIPGWELISENWASGNRDCRCNAEDNSSKMCYHVAREEAFSSAQPKPLNLDQEKSSWGLSDKETCYECKPISTSNCSELMRNSMCVDGHIRSSRRKQHWRPRQELMSLSMILHLA